MVAGARFCDAVIGRPLETAHRQVTAWGRRDGVSSRDFERRAPKNLETTLGASHVYGLSALGPIRDSQHQKIFFSKASFTQRLPPLCGQNHFWASFWQRGHD